MIKSLDLTLKELLKKEAESGSELEKAAISFAVPDEKWRDQGSGLHLNVYLFDIRENRKLRSNERQHIRHPGGLITQKKSPPRIDCAFIISAWNKETSPTEGAEDKELQEHRLLSQVLQILIRHPVIPPGYLQGLLIEQEPDLPMITAQQNGLPDPVEFWNALNSCLKPSINCIVTISLQSGELKTDHMVTTKIIRYQLKGKPETAKEIIRIGGRVTDKTNPEPGISGALVSIPDLHKQTVTDTGGYYTFCSFPRGEFRCLVHKDGYRDAEFILQVPAPTAEKNYDIQLSK